jgi:hypothetical protein
MYIELYAGGCLYLATENRFSFKYFMARKEPHTGLPFISLLPARLAQAYSMRVRNAEYREITYSLHGLRRLLEAAGFEQIRFFFPIPGYQNFRYLADLEDKNELRFLLGQLRTHPRFSRWLHLAGRAALALPGRPERFFWPSFSVFAVRS